MRLYVGLRNSQFLSEILINNPGMIDDLMDSLVVDRPEPAIAIKAELAELCRGAEDLAPILLSFRNKEWVRIGTRDILGREPIRDVTRELADVAEAIVMQVAPPAVGLPRPAVRRPAPRTTASGRAGRSSRWASSAGELNYTATWTSSSSTRPTRDQGGATSLPNEQFVTEVARRVLKALEHDKPVGPLYRVDTRLRPHGASGPLVVTLDAFRAYFQTKAHSWERLALTRSRTIFSNGGFGKVVAEAIHDVLAVPRGSSGACARRCRDASQARRSQHPDQPEAQGSAA